MLTQRAKQLVGKPARLTGTIDQVLLDGDKHRFRVILPGGNIQEFEGGQVFVCPDGESAHSYDLVSHLYRQREFSLTTFGPGARTKGVTDHIKKELDVEIAAKPHDLEEWVDVILLALDGAWRAGHEPGAIAAAMQAKLAKNEQREWPDWRTADPDKAIEHVRSSDNNAVT